MSGAIQREQGESFASFAARQKAAQEAERAARPMPAKRKRRASTGTQSSYGLDMFRGEITDDLGESHD